MKSYTNLKQSRKLAEFLPLESADMYYDVDSYGVRTTPEVLITSIVRKKDIPCWSLAALLSVIPKPDLVQNSEGTWLLHSWINDYPWSVGGYSNPVDACVAMIEKLHEQNIL